LQNGTELKGLGGKEGMLTSTKKFGQAEYSEITISRPPRLTENAGEFSVTANVLLLLSPDIAPFVSWAANMQHEMYHRTLQTRSSALTLLCGSDLLPQYR
jgi:hypothetical protein